MRQLLLLVFFFPPIVTSYGFNDASGTDVLVSPVDVQHDYHHGGHHGLFAKLKEKKEKETPLQPGRLQCAPGFVIMNRQCHQMTTKEGEWVCDDGGPPKKKDDRHICTKVIPQSYQCRSGFEPDGPAGFECVSRDSVPAVVTCPLGFHIDESFSYGGGDSLHFVQGFEGMKCVNFTPVDLVDECLPHELKEEGRCVSFKAYPPIEQCPYGCSTSRGPLGELECFENVEYECSSHLPVQEHHIPPIAKHSKHWRNLLYSKQGHATHKGIKNKKNKHPTEIVEYVVEETRPQLVSAMCTKEVRVQSEWLCIDGSPPSSVAEPLQLISAQPVEVEKKWKKKNKKSKDLAPAPIVQVVPGLMCQERKLREPETRCPVVDHPTMGCVRIETAVPDKRCPRAGPQHLDHHHTHGPHNGPPAVTSMSSSATLNLNYVVADSGPKQIFVPAGHADHYHHYRRQLGNSSPEERLEGAVSSEASHCQSGVIEGGRCLGDGQDDGDSSSDVDGFQWGAYFDDDDDDDRSEIDHPSEADLNVEDADADGSHRRLVDFHGHEGMMDMIMDKFHDHPHSSARSSSSIDLVYGAGPVAAHANGAGRFECSVEHREEAIPTCPSNMQSIGIGPGGKCYKEYPATFICPTGWKRLADKTGCAIDMVVEPNLMVQPPPIVIKKKKGKHHHH